VDTPGADPGPGSEAEGIASEIAETLAAMAEAAVPTVAVCVGEGGSGGGLAFAAADRLLMLEHAVFSVIGPEGAAAILARDPAQASQYADRLRLTAADVARLGIADAVIAESEPTTLDAAIGSALDGAVVGDRLRRLDAVTARWVR
jgi:acetyl-CoA carboxylase carboxyl transferase subunit beta